jgi:hypothetical protein
MTLKTFISHSGVRSRSLAEELESFVRRLVPSSNPWISPTGIDKGTRWGAELAQSLGDSSAGIVCLTPENLKEEWILFEAGALSREPSDRVWTFLFDVKDSDLPAPLAQFQNTKATKADVLLLMQSINRVVGGNLVKDADLVYMFEKLWPELDKRMTEIRAMSPEREPEQRPDRDIIREVLTTVRDLGKQSSEDSFRVAKTLAMLHQIYRQVLGTNAPSLDELVAMQKHASVEGLVAALRGSDLSWMSGSSGMPYTLRASHQPGQTTVSQPIGPFHDDDKK